MIKDINGRPKTLKLQQENIGNTFQDIGISDEFLNKNLKTQEIRA
jgi:hypothetical protein